MDSSGGEFREQGVALLAQMRRQFFEYILEHRSRVEPGTLVERARNHGFAPRCADLILEFLQQRGMSSLIPFVKEDKVLLQSIDRVPERPIMELIARSVPRRIIARRVRTGPVTDVLDERRPVALSRPFGSPTRGRVDREEIIAIDTQTRETNARSACSE